MPRRLTIPGKVWTWLRIAISLILLAALLSRIGYKDVVQVLTRIVFWPVVLAALMVIFSRALVAYRWYILVRSGASRINFIVLLRLVFVTGFLGFFVPGAVGVELVRVYALARLTDLAMALSSVLIERLTALAALAAIVLLGLLAAPIGLPDAVGTAAAATLALLLVVILGLFARRLRPFYLALVTRPLLAPLGGHLVAFFQQIDAFRQAPRLMLQLAILSVGLQLLRVFEGIFLAVALGVDVELAYLFVIIPAGVLVTMLPISLGGLGVREAMYVALFGAIGVDAASAFALSFVNFLLVVVVLLLPGAILYAFGGLALEAGTSGDRKWRR